MIRQLPIPQLPIRQLSLIAAALATLSTLPALPLAGQETTDSTHAVLSARTAPFGEQLDSASAGGRFVTLADGTWWEVAPSDRTATDVWQAGDYLAVHPAPAPSATPRATYDVLLLNSTTGRRVAARFIGFGAPNRDPEWSGQVR
jgi:hypothetical protein